VSAVARGRRDRRAPGADEIPADGETPAAGEVSEDQPASPTPSIAVSLKLRIFSSIVASFDVSESQAPAVETLNEAVDTIAAASEPLSAVA
jgi:hypothetical protein